MLQKKVSSIVEYVFPEKLLLKNLWNWKEIEVKSLNISFILSSIW